eukprot:119933-Amphidinium_carterae.1
MPPDFLHAVLDSTTQCSHKLVASRHPPIAGKAEMAQATFSNVAKEWTFECHIARCIYEGCDKTSVNTVND